MTTATPGALAWTRLLDEISEFTSELFDGHKIVGIGPYTSTKTIRDSVHGYFELHPWEVEILDSPLVQRLRYIHQTALAYHIYPAAHHTRLEHSLGTAKLISDVCASLRRDPNWRDLFDESVEEELRLGALLHDVGHCLFSHLSENVIDEYFAEEFVAIKNSSHIGGRATGEILSHALLISPPVQSFLQGVFEAHNKDLDPVRIAGYCVGQPDATSPDAYRADLITGPLDVDKLDYLQRDTYSTGIHAEIDAQHIIRSLTVFEDGDGSRTIAVKLPAVAGVEQLHFAKALLYPAIYHHQKVRALEGTVRGVFEAIRDDPSGLPDHMRFTKVSDFFRATEYDFLSLEQYDNRPGRLVRDLVRRKVLRRALYVSQSSIAVDDPKEHPGYQQFVNLGRDEPEAYLDRDDLRAKIFNEIAGDMQTDPAKLWLDVPDAPKFKDLAHCVVVDPDNQPLELTDLFPMDGWLTAYRENKWNAHVFYEPDSEMQQAANIAAKEVLFDEFGLTFGATASRYAKVPQPK